MAKRDIRSSFRQNRLVRLFVVAQTWKDWLSQLLVRCPFLKCDLRDQPWLKPGDVLLTGWIDERRAAANGWAERFGEVGERLFTAARESYNQEPAVM
ncbi:MAG TPA: hypothetical protein VMV27_03835 [Candidatus Binataceae bacterium]|nr:hypothetical protein [Candidatus Binataceae bacterium]